MEKATSPGTGLWLCMGLCFELRCVRDREDVWRLGACTNLLPTTVCCRLGFMVHAPRQSQQSPISHCTATGCFLLPHPGLGYGAGQGCRHTVTLCVRMATGEELLSPEPKSPDIRELACHTPFQTPKLRLGSSSTVGTTTAIQSVGCFGGSFMHLPEFPFFLFSLVVSG